MLLIVICGDDDGTGDVETCVLDGTIIGALGKSEDEVKRSHSGKDFSSEVCGFGCCNKVGAASTEEVGKGCHSNIDRAKIPNNNYYLHVKAMHTHYF